MAATNKSKLAKEEKARALKLSVIAELEGLASGKIVPSESHFGICAHMEEAFDLWDMVTPYSADWSRHSGNDSYPVPSTAKGVSEYKHFWRAKSLWTGKYGALRKQLCRHIAKVLRSEVRKGDYVIRTT